MALPKSVLLIITGSVAAYKSLELIRLMRAQGIAVTAILSKGGAEFITPLAVSALTGTTTYSDLFSLTDEIEMGHIELSRVADLVLVAPASASILAKMAAGIADDLATTALLATNKPVIVAPAMNHKMWSHAATQRNIAQLLRDGVQLISPTEGDMACGEFGIGRFAEPAAIMAALRHSGEGISGGKPSPLGGEGLDEGTHSSAPSLHAPSPNPLPKGRGLSPAAPLAPLKGRRAIVTSGPTVEAIDPVRYLGNRSSGKQGHAIAQALADAGAEVTLLCGNVNIPDPVGVNIVRIHNADSMLEAAENALPADIFVGAAAVADWKPTITANQKIKKQPALDVLSLEFLPTVDVLASIAKHAKRPTLVVGFAAETENVLDHARAKRLRKGCDWILANEVGATRGFAVDENAVTLITPDGEENWPLASKHEIAAKLTQKISDYFDSLSTKKGKPA